MNLMILSGFVSRFMHCQGIQFMWSLMTQLNSVKTRGIGERLPFSHPSLLFNIHSIHLGEVQEMTGDVYWLHANCM